MLLIGLFVACGGVLSAVPQQAGSKNVLYIDSFTLVVLVDGQVHGLSVKKNGDMFLNGEKKAIVKAVGIADTNGKTVVEFRNDTIRAPKGRGIIRIEQDGTFIENSFTFRWNSTGELCRDGKPTGLRIERNNNKIHRCASVVILGYFAM